MKKQFVRAASFIILYIYLFTPNALEIICRWLVRRLVSLENWFFFHISKTAIWKRFLYLKKHNNSDQSSPLKNIEIILVYKQKMRKKIIPLRKNSYVCAYWKIELLLLKCSLITVCRQKLHFTPKKSQILISDHSKQLILLHTYWSKKKGSYRQLNFLLHNNNLKPSEPMFILLWRLFMF